MAQSDRRPRRGGRQEPPGQPEELAHPSEEPGGRAGRVLTEVGWVQDVIVHKASGFVVDVELDEREEAVILATLDPVTMPGDMAARIAPAPLRGCDGDRRGRTIKGSLLHWLKICTLSTKAGLKVFQSCRRRKL